jgi:ribosomal protein L22
MTPPDETPEETKPKRRRRKPAVDAPAPEATADAPAPEAPGSSEATTDAELAATRGASDADASTDSEEPEAIEQTPEDVEAEEAAADVMLEADDEAEEPEAEEAPAPAPSRRRRRGERRDVVVRAQAKYVRSSARKARLVCDHIRGKSVEEARAILAHTSRAVARDWSKLLESAVANAENNHELVGEDLYVMTVHADEGPTIRRFRPRAMGRATRIRKRTSHLTILLTPKD